MTANRSSHDPRPPTTWRSALEDARRRRDELDKMRASRLAVLQRAGAAMRSLRDSMAANVANDVAHDIESGAKSVREAPNETGIYRAVRRDEKRDDDRGDDPHEDRDR